MFLLMNVLQYECIITELYKSIRKYSCDCVCINLQRMIALVFIRARLAGHVYVCAHVDTVRTSFYIKIEDKTVKT